MIDVLAIMALSDTNSTVMAITAVSVATSLDWSHQTSSQKNRCHILCLNHMRAQPLPRNGQKERRKTCALL